MHNLYFLNLSVSKYKNDILKINMQTMKSIYISTSVSLFCVYHSILYTLFCIYYYIMQLYYKFEKSIALNYRLQCGICIKYLLYLKNNIVG